MPESSYTADLPAALTLESGATASLPLSGPLRSGYTWSAAVDGSAVTAAITYQPADPVGEPSSPTSFAGQRLRLDAVRPGTALVRIELARSWESGSPLAAHALKVTVHGPDGPQ